MNGFSYCEDVAKLHNIQISNSKCTLAGKKLEDIGDVRMELAPLKLAFPAVVKLLQFSMTMCVSTAKFERSFSALIMKRIKSYLFDRL